MGEPARSAKMPDLGTQGFTSPSGPLAPLTNRSALMQLSPLPAVAEPQAKSTLSTSTRDLPLRIGEPRDTLHAAISALRVEWSSPVEGRRTARLAIRSPGAKALRVALRTGSAQGMTIRVQGSASPAVTVVQRDEDSLRAQSDFWTPATDGEQQDIEISIADRADLPLPQITVPTVSHFTVPVGGRAAAGDARGKVTAAGDGCSENVVCLPNPTNAFLNAARATVKLIFTRQGSSYSCSGTLINDGEFQTQIPYILTAAHCVDSDTTALTANIFFFFEATTCGGSDVPTFRQLSAGARLVHVNTISDVALLRLNDPAPAGAWFSGWDATVALDGVAVLFIHHPNGGAKAFSIGKTLPPALEDDVSGLHHLVTWISGSSTGGSSGGGMLTLAGDQYLVRGVLHGGSANCAFSGQTLNPLNRDFFTHLDEDAEALRRILLGGPAPLQNYSDLWNSTTELGWGMTIFQSADNQMLLSWYTHDDSGSPIWYLSLGGKWVSAVRYEGMLARVQSTSATMTYDPARLSTTNVGTVALEFSSSDRASMTFTLNGVTRTKPLKRFSFAP